MTAKAVLRAHSNKVTAVAAAKGDEEEVVLSGGRDKALIAWSVRRQCVLRKQKKLQAEVTALVVCPHDSDVAMVALSTGAVTLWKWKKGVFKSDPVLQDPV
jgi:WD40 repeat protein